MSVIVQAAVFVVAMAQHQAAYLADLWNEMGFGDPEEPSEGLFCWIENMDLWILSYIFKSKWKVTF